MELARLYPLFHILMTSSCCDFACGQSTSDDNGDKMSDNGHLSCHSSLPVFMKTIAAEMREVKRECKSYFGNDQSNGNATSRDVEDVMLKSEIRIESRLNQLEVGMQNNTAKLESIIVDLNRKHEIDLAEIIKKIKTAGCLSTLQQMIILNLTTELTTAASNVIIKVKRQEEDIANLTATVGLLSPGEPYRTNWQELHTLKLCELLSFFPVVNFDIISMHQM